MHYHCEVILPAGTEDIPAAVAAVLKPFDEGLEEGDESRNGMPFWDFFVIGGRFAGEKLKQGLDPEKLEEFLEWCRSNGVTVSSLQFGKPELKPSSQIPKIDAKWNEMFPHPSGWIVPCVLFKHSNDQYGEEADSMIYGDICALNHATYVKCDRVIIAAPSYSSSKDGFNGPLEARFMIEKEYWNGVVIVESAWDGTVGSAVCLFKEYISGWAEQFKAVATPQDNWIAVTVDYHS